MDILGVFVGHTNQNCVHPGLKSPRQFVAAPVTDIKALIRPHG
jgi:hypothetical protein